MHSNQKPCESGGGREGGLEQAGTRAGDRGHSHERRCAIWKPIGTVNGHLGTVNVVLLAVPRDTRERVLLLGVAAHSDVSLYASPCTANPW